MNRSCLPIIFSFQKEINTAILIRSLLAKDGQIYFRAGAGIVESSNPESELNEIDNKLRALTLALTVAEIKQQPIPNSELQAIPSI